MTRLSASVSQNKINASYAVVRKVCGETVGKVYLLGRIGGLRPSVVAMMTHLSVSKVEEALAIADRALADGSPSESVA